MSYKHNSISGRRIPKVERSEKCHEECNDNNKHGQEMKAFYSSPLWQQVRDRTFERYDHIDIYKYVVSGAVLPATIVHHIVPLDEDKNLSTSEDNLIPVSVTSHYEIHRAYDLGKKDRARMQNRLRYCINEYKRKF